MSEAAGSLVPPAELAGATAAVRRVEDGLGKVLLGQDRLIERVLTGLLARGNLLLEGLPGLGKTELIKGLGRLLDLKFRRIQFTPDLLPSDITGSHILEEDERGRRAFAFHPGPIFASLVLADEINRASPKTQSALLEAMQEHGVTVLGETRRLPEPFFVLATQNPIELEGTYPLPEAQLDRFLFKIPVGGVGEEVLSRIAETRVRGQPPALEPVLGTAELLGVLELVDRIYLPPAVAGYIGRLVAATHRDHPAAPGVVKQHVRWGASPRGAIAIAAAARALALVRGKPNVGFDEVKEVAVPALAHRLVLEYSARLEGLSGEGIVERVLSEVSELRRPMPEGIAS
ncbi:MAG: AAA family ATPase [Planctomycetes bacterium]|nr:AAA family ATPase [Planctomycetota bacterium]